MPGCEAGRVCSFLPPDLCLGTLWLQPGKRSSRVVRVGGPNQRWDVCRNPAERWGCWGSFHSGICMCVFVCVCVCVCEREREREREKLSITWILENWLYFISSNSNRETSFSYCVLSTACFAPRCHRSAFYFLRKVEDWFCNSVVRGCRGGSGRKRQKGLLLSYLMVFSNYALFRLPLAYVLITSKHSDGSVQPVELSPSSTWDQVLAHPHAVAERLRWTLGRW